MDLKWIDGLAPDEAKAALDSLDAREGPYTVTEILKLREMRLRLQARVERKRPPARGR